MITIQVPGAYHSMTAQFLASSSNVFGNTLLATARERLVFTSNSSRKAPFSTPRFDHVIKSQLQLVIQRLLSCSVCADNGFFAALASHAMPLSKGLCPRSRVGGVIS